MKSILAALAVLVSSAVSADMASTTVSSFADVASWTGSGTNTTVLVVDFNGAATENRAFAWGYRWNGNAPTIEKVVERIAAADPRLTVEFGEGGGFIERIAYDSDGDPATPSLEGALDINDREDGDRTYSSGTLWALLTGKGETYPVDGLEEPPMEDLNPVAADGLWICWRLASFDAIYQDEDIIEDNIDLSSEQVPVAAEPSALTPVSSFTDVETWVGEGAHETVFVIDFNDGSVANCSFAWGYRWDGDAPTVETALNEIAAADPRLTVTISQSTYGGFLQNIAYDHDNNPYTPDLVGCVEDYSDSDEEYYYYYGTSWMLLAGDGATYPRDEVAETPNGMSLTTVEDGGWICWRVCTYASTYVNPTFDCVDDFVDTTSFYDPVSAWALPEPEPEPEFLFSDVQAWVGTGDNHTVLVIDFNDGSVDNCSFAWGYRWDGDAPSIETIMSEIAAADPRLAFTISQSTYGGLLQQVSYDHDDDPSTPALEGCVEDYFDSDEEYYYYNGTSWMLLAGNGDAFPRDDVAETPNGMSSVFPAHGDWYCWRVCAYSSTYVNPTFDFVDYFVDTTSRYNPVAADPIPADSVAAFADVQAWVGSGAHETVFVIDFNDGSVASCSFAWGYRWDGDAPTVETALNEIAAADPRLTVTISQSTYGGFLQNIAYDHDNNPYTPDLVGCVEDYSDMDADYFYYNGTSWMLLVGEGATFPRDGVAEAPNGMSLTTVEDGGWICWRVCTYSSIYVNPTFDFVDNFVDTTSHYDPVSAWTFPAETTPELVEPTIESIAVAADTVTVVPGNVVDGAYYGLAVADTPAGPFAAPTEWVRAENGSAVLTAPKSGDRAFFRVVVTATPAQ